MSNPITLHPRNNTVEGMRFTGDIDNARDIARWIVENSNRRPDLRVAYSRSLYEPSYLELVIGEESYQLTSGDWIIRDGDLFSAVPHRERARRYVTPIEKIKLEAGLD
jgi:hypothetical protein